MRVLDFLLPHNATPKQRFYPTHLAHRLLVVLKPTAGASDTADAHQKLILRKVVPEINASETAV